jgi:AAA domain
MTEDYQPPPGFEEDVSPPPGGPRPNGADRDPLSTIWADEIELDLTDCGVIDGYMPRTGIGVSYGESGSGKSFVVLDRACHVAAGLPWRGMDVAQGVVIYIAAEAPESVKRRVWAWKRHHQVEHPPLLIVQASVDLLNGSTTALVELVRKITKEHGHVAMVVIDTLARAMTGNENAPDDMGKFVSGCGAIREAGETMVLVVHHCGKNTALGARGHSSLRAATDYEEEITLNEEGAGSIKVTKSRDDVSGRTLGFRLDTFELGRNSKGRMVTTCVVHPADPPPKKPPKAPLGPVQKILVEELRKLYRRHPEGVAEGDLKSAFVLALDAKRGREGKGRLEPKQYTGKFNETLASVIAGGHVDRLENNLLKPGP